MNLPQLNVDGYLPPGIYFAELDEVLAQFGASIPTRERQGNLLRLIVGSARKYPTIKRVLLWGSFISAKPESGDLDYSIVVDPRHPATTISPEDRRFFIPYNANIHYGVDRGYLLLREYPLDDYFRSLELICHDRAGQPRGIVEVNCHD
jgi:hypothetical protein